VKTLRRSGVPFVVVGSVAASWYVRLPQAPSDLDIVVAGGWGAACKAVNAIEGLIRRYRDVHVGTFSIGAVADGAPIVVETPIGTLDMVPFPGGEPEQRDAIVRRRRWIYLDWTWTPIASLDTLITLKEQNLRAKDHDLALLRDAATRRNDG
jgi:hypothetical protein